MATLVLSTVGSTLGGPVGGAIGALIGQSIDQQLLAPASRGPRVGDLNVQTSTYGTQMPRLYGTMRVAGSVVWATDLIESSTTTGAKGQPSTTYSYSVSMAVALSSRPLSAIKRIWADGKLLRGAEGDFKVGTDFRFHDGSEDQPIDPLIGSIEGIGNSPAYRGTALAVFENLELAEFGNRIPFLTFEVVGDNAPPMLSEILYDASRGGIVSPADQTLVGYAAYGRSVRAAVEPLITCFGTELFDDGLQLRGPASVAPQAIAADDLGSSADGQRVARVQREQSPSRSIPSAQRLTYYDPARDYQTGEARATTSEQGGNEDQVELAATIAASDAKSLVQQMLARSWAGRDKLTLRLPQRYIALEPGCRLDLPLSPSRWVVETCSIDAFLTVAELRPSSSPAVPMAAEPGRIVPNPDVGGTELSVALFDVPDVLGQGPTEPTLLLAASMASPGWKRRTIEVEFGGQVTTVQPASRKTILGHATSLLGPGEPYLIDTAGTVEVQLIDAEQWLVSRDDDALAAGSNLAVLGNELIQFGRAEPLGGGLFRLSRLLRGRMGTEWASAAHSSGEAFALIQRDAVQIITVPLWVVGSDVIAAADGPEARVSATGESLKPPSPIALTSEIEPNGDLRVSWARRSRSGWAWIDEMDARSARLAKTIAWLSQGPRR